MSKKTIRLLALSFLALLLISSIGHVLAKPAMQPGPPTGPPGQEEEATATPESSISIVQPAPTSEPDPDLLTFPDGWQNPTNLSRSGSTSAPQMVIDSSGTTHVLWSDRWEGFGYSFGRNSEWSPPQSPEFPFFTRRYFPDLREEDATPRYSPTLVAGTNGQIYAFWIDDNEILYYSSAPAADLANYDAWTPRAGLSDGVRSLDAAVGAEGAIHLAFVRSSDTASRPAGVYYRRLGSDGTWNESTLLYASRYLRAAPEETATISILPVGDAVYVAWDDTVREQVYLTIGRENGSNWSPAMEIDRRKREDNRSAVGPKNIALGSDGATVHLSWAAGHEVDEDCTQYVSFSSDQGATWSEPADLTMLPGCFASFEFFSTDDALFLLGITGEEEEEADDEPARAVYIMAWNGSQWSDPQGQESLSAFVNPETNQFVQLQCHQGLSRGNVIEVLGCDTGEGGDIWLVSREYGDILEWFPPPPVWQGPLVISSGDSVPSESKLVASVDGNVHGFWNEEESGRIFHTVWNGENWSAGQAVITSPSGEVMDFSAAAANDRLYVAWQDSMLGLHFSEASLTDTAEWSAPVPLVPEQVAASAPRLAADAGGNVFLAYVLQLNEERGVYLLHSADAGTTWSNPIQVFDAVDAGWDMVDDPRLAHTENGHLHLLWARRSLPPESVPLALAYSRSEDLGQSWSPGETVLEGQAEWYDLAGAGERIVHRLWTEAQNGQTGLWHSYSMDGGLTWDAPEQVARAESSTSIDTAVDAVTRLQVLALNDGQLANLVWDESSWAEEAPLATDLGAEGQLAAVANQSGDLVATYVDRDTAAGANAIGRLYGMWRTLELPSAPPTPLPSLTPTAVGPTPTATATPQPTATIFFPTEPDQSGVGNIPGLAGLPIGMDLVLSILPVLVIVAIGIIVGVRIIRKR